LSPADFLLRSAQSIDRHLHCVNLKLKPPDDAISRCGKRDPARPAQIAFTQTVEQSGRPIALEMERGVPYAEA